MQRTERRQVPRNRWRVTAEKFRTVDRQTAARDADLIAAQSKMVIIEKLVERAFPQDERARRSIMEAVRDRIAGHLERGHSFARATVAEPVQDRHHSGSGKDNVRQNQFSDRLQERER